jgi:hypothetical protein
MINKIIKIEITTIFLFFSLVIVGQNEKKIYFSDSLFCLVEFNHTDTLWHIVKDGAVRDSVESWSFGTISKSKDSINLNCFLTFNRKNKENRCGETLWTRTISRKEYIEKTSVANSKEECDLLPKLTTKFVTNYYWFINAAEHSALNEQDRNETIKYNKFLGFFLDYFQNDSLKFIRRIVSYLDSSNVNFHEKAFENFEKENYGEALFYSKVYSSMKYELNEEEVLYNGKHYIYDIYEISMIHYLDLQHVYAYFNPYNYALIDKIKQSKGLFPKTKRYGDVWWGDSLNVGDIIKCPTISHRIGGGGLNENSEDSVKVIADVIKNNPNFIFEISYHTDHRGSSRGNLKLSENTANFLRHYLINECNIDPEHIRATGYGESKPIIPFDEIESADESEKEKLYAINRRYELKIVERVTKDLNRTPSDGEYLFDAAFAEWQGKSMGVKVTVTIKGDSIKVVYAGGGNLTAKIGEVLDEGVIMKHKTGVWIIGSRQGNKVLDEVGGCTGGPSVIDFENKKYWMC